MARGGVRVPRRRAGYPGRVRGPCGCLLILLIAVHAAASGEIVAVLVHGYTGNAIAGAAIASHKFIKPSTAVAGRVLEASSFSEAQLSVSHIHEATAAGNTIQIGARLSSRGP